METELRPDRLPLRSNVPGTLASNGPRRPISADHPLQGSCLHPLTSVRQPRLAAHRAPDLADLRLRKARATTPSISNSTTTPPRTMSVDVNLLPVVLDVLSRTGPLFPPPPAKQVVLEGQAMV